MSNNSVPRIRQKPKAIGLINKKLKLKPSKNEGIFEIESTVKNIRKYHLLNKKL